MRAITARRMTGARRTLTDLGALIRHRRETAGLSLAALGEKVGMTKVRLHYIEKGHWMPTVDEMARLDAWWDSIGKTWAEKA